MGRLMNKFSKDPINPLIGSAGVSAVPMAALFSLHDAAFTAFAAGAAIWAVTYAAVAIVKQGAMGGGDVKLALTLGGVTGWSAGRPARSSVRSPSG